MNVIAIAAVGRRGQLSRNGNIPWSSPKDLAYFKRATTGCVMIAGMRTYQQMMPRVGPSLAETKRTLIGWSPKEGTPRDFIIDMKGRGVKALFVVGGAYTYRAFCRFVDEVDISVIGYDSDPRDDKLHLFFPFAPYEARGFKVR